MPARPCDGANAPVMKTQLNAVVTEELRVRSDPERELVDGKEAVELVGVRGFVREFATPPEGASSPVSARILANALQRNLQLSKQLKEDLSTARARVADRVSERDMAQTSAEEFLSRPYHEVKRNRFLFCEAGEAESYSNNRANGWNDTIARAHLADGRRGSRDATPDHGIGAGVACWRAGGRGRDATALSGSSTDTGGAASSSATGSIEDHSASAPCSRNAGKLPVVWQA